MWIGFESHNAVARRSSAEATLTVHIQACTGGVLVPVKVVPGASRTRILGELDGFLRIAVAAPAQRGRANAALIACLAKWLGLRRRQISITTGATSARKTIAIEGVTADTVLALLASAAD